MGQKMASHILLHKQKLSLLSFDLSLLTDHVHHFYVYIVTLNLRVSKKVEKKN